MKRKFKYDIAFSVAEEDLAVAKSIAAALRHKNIHYYLYTEHTPANLGKPILKITLDTYGSGAKYVLMLTSKVFVKKYWAGIENQVAQLFATGRDAYIIQVKLDDTIADGLSKHTVFLTWNNNPEEIARLLVEKLQQITDEKPGKKFTGRIKVILLITLLALGIYIVNKGSQYFINTGYINKDDGRDTTPLQHRDTQTRVINHPDPVKQPVIGKTRKKDTPISRHSVPQENTALKINTPITPEFDFSVEVSGNNPSLNAMVGTGIQAILQGKSLTITTKPQHAKKIITVSLQEQSAESETYNGIGSSCNYQVYISDKNGHILQSGSGREVKPGFSREANYQALSTQIITKLKLLL